MTDSATKPAFSRSRSLLSAAVIILTCVALLSSILAVWAKRTLLDTNRFSNGVETQLSDPVVSDALGTWVGDQVSGLIGTSTVESVLPDRLDIVAPFLANTLQSFVSDKAKEFVESDTGRALVVDAVRIAHAVALRVLEGEIPKSGIVIVEDGRVMLNLIPLVFGVARKIQDLGIASSVTLPDINKSQTPTEQIDLLSNAIGRDLPSDFGQITVYQRKADADGTVVGTAQQVLKLFRAVMWLLIALTLVLAGLAIWLSPRRGRGVMWLGIGIAATGLLAHLTIQRVVNAVPKLVTDPDARAATKSVADGLVGRLDRTLLSLAFVSALLVILIATVIAQGPAAFRARVRAFAERRPDAVRIGAVVFAVVLLFWWGLQWWSAVVALALVVAGFLIVRESTGESAATSSA